LVKGIVISEREKVMTNREHAIEDQEKLPRVRIEFPLSEQERAGADQAFFAKLKEELDIIPAQGRVIEYFGERKRSLMRLMADCASKRDRSRSIPRENVSPASNCWPVCWWPSMQMSCCCIG
jgi:hypothetical protein